MHPQCCHGCDRYVSILRSLHGQKLNIRSTLKFLVWFYSHKLDVLFYFSKEKIFKFENFPLSLYDAFFQKEIDIAFKKWPNHPAPQKMT